MAPPSAPDHNRRPSDERRLSWHPLPEWDGLRLMTLFRERLLAKLGEKRAISNELVAKLVAWRHPGFSG